MVKTKRKLSRKSKTEFEKYQRNIMLKFELQIYCSNTNKDAQ